MRITLGTEFLISRPYCQKDLLKTAWVSSNVLGIVIGSPAAAKAV